MVDRLEGADAAALNAKTAALCGAARTPLPPAAAQVRLRCAVPARACLTPRASQPDINTRLAALVHSAPVMLFMKGAQRSQQARTPDNRRVGSLTPLLFQRRLA